jgi:predicted AAA+ superfamily ATPase
MELITRHLAPEVRKRYRQARSLYVHGARQTGKTTLARMTFPDLPYVSLESPDAMLFAREDAREFLSRYPKGAILDEVQRVPEILSYLQGIIDHSGARWVLTGSQNFLLMEKVSQSLAGRISVLELTPFSQREIRGLRHRGIFTVLQRPGTSPAADSREIEETILMGGYPEVVMKPAVGRFWFADYLRTCVERDIRQIINVQDTALFQRFVGLCAGRSGGMLNLASLAGDAGIGQNTCRRWLSLLETGGIIFLLPPYHRNFNKRLIKSPKLFFVDTGLLCYLLNIKTPDELRYHPLAGQVFETFMVGEIRKTVLNGGGFGSLSFWRDNHGTEVDLVMEEGNVLHAVEIKRGATFNPDMVRNLKKFSTYAAGRTVSPSCIYGGDEGFTRQGVRVISWKQL